MLRKLREGLGLTWFRSKARLQEERETGVLYPSLGTIFRWRNEDPAFDARVMRAMESHANVVFMEQEEIERDVLRGRLDPRAADVAMRNQWRRLGTLMPGRFGQKVQVATMSLAELLTSAYEDGVPAPEPAAHDDGSK